MPEILKQWRFHQDRDIHGRAVRNSYWRERLTREGRVKLRADLDKSELKGTYELRRGTDWSKYVLVLKVFSWKMAQDQVAPTGSRMEVSNA